MRTFGGAAPSVSETKLMVTDVIENEKVALFTKSGCPYCAQTKQTFDRAFVDYAEIDRTEDVLGHEIPETLKQISGSSTFPQVFIGGEYIGGNDDFHQAIEDGTVQKKLDAINALHDF